MNNPRCDIVNLCFGKKSSQGNRGSYRQYIEKVTSSRDAKRAKDAYLFIPDRRNSRLSVSV